MDVSFIEVKEVVDELPIGYYAKRRVSLTLDANGRDSYYNPCDDEIVISYPLIALGLKNAVDEQSEYRETAIRSMVYHEVSHAIMTPDNLMPCCYGTFRDVMNIFEDERIETILKDFYMDTNFKKNVLYINGGKINPPTDALSAFYNLVRFRVCNDESLLKEVERIIEDYPNLFETDNYSYIYEVKELYKKIEKLYKNKSNNPFDVPQQQLEEIAEKINQENNGKGYEENNSAEKEKTKGGKDKSGSKADGEDGENGESGNGEGEKTESKGGEDGDENGKRESGETYSETYAEDDNKKQGGNGRGGKNISPFENLFNNYRDGALVESLKAIINTFNKKNSSGNGCNGYSGVFNPRNIKNENYKYFDRKLSTRGNNRFGKLHLNLFIDESGSFYGMQDSANKIIYALCEVERTNPNFTFDLICDTEGFRETDKSHRRIKAGGGNELSYDEVVGMMKKHTAKDGYTYNIVLHDGWVGCKFKSKNFFLGWDRNNVTIIDTGGNQNWLEDCKNARIVISPYRDLVNNLGDEIVKTLQLAFR